MSLKQTDQCKTASLALAAPLTAALVLGAYQTSNPTYPTYVQAELGNARIEAASAPADGGAVTIHRYESPPMDAVNTYWIETDEGVVIIDAQRFLSQARYALKEVRAQTDKPILGILITHPHTDHYGGLPIFVEAAGSDVPIYAAQITAEEMRTDRQNFIEARNELHGNDFPDHEDIPNPNRIVQDGEEIEIGGLTIRANNLPENETIVTTVYYLPEEKALFVGDLVNVKTTPFLGEGNSRNWVRQLRTLLERYPEAETVYPGHGDPGSAKELLRAQIEYIETLCSLVADALTSGGEVTPEEKENILAEMEERYPDYQTSLLLPGLLERGVEGIAEEMSDRVEEKTNHDRHYSHLQAG